MSKKVSSPSSVKPAEYPPVCILSPAVLSQEQVKFYEEKGVDLPTWQLVIKHRFKSIETLFFSPSSTTMVLGGKKQELVGGKAYLSVEKIEGLLRAVKRK